MGKNKHSQDKLWITYKELVQDWGGKTEESGYRSQPIKKLPFYCCSLSFMPFKDPVCLPDGTIFALKKPSSGGDLSALGATGVNNYNELWYTKNLYAK